jgi:hypothetical protein
LALTLGLLACRADSPPEQRAAMTIRERHTLMVGRHGRLVPQPDGFLAVAMQSNGLAAADGFDRKWRPTGYSAQLTDDTVIEQDHDVAVEVNSWVRAYESTRGTERRVTVRRRGPQGDILAQSPRFVAEEDELPLDLHVMVSDGLTYLATEYRREPERWVAPDGALEQNLPPDERVARGVRLRVLSPDLGLLRQVDLAAQVAGAQVPHQPWGMGSCSLRVDGSLYLFTAAPVGDSLSFAEGESAGTRQIFALRYSDALTQTASNGPLTPPGQDSYWPTGCVYHRDHFFISHTMRERQDGPVMGPPALDDGHVAVAMLSRDLELREWLVVSETAGLDFGSGEGAQRSAILADGDQLWVSYDQGGQIHLAQLLLEL